MSLQRRDFLRTSAGAVAMTMSPRRADAQYNGLAAELEQAMNAQVLRTELFKQPVKIASLELLKNDRSYLVRARSTDGVTGYSEAHSAVMGAAYPILIKKVAPTFIGRDARELEPLLREVYLAQSNYKWQGLPFWVSVAAVEIAILDMLGKAVNKPLGELFGPIAHRNIPVYRATGNRGNAPEAEIAYLQKIVAETGAGAIKFRLGARMRYDDASTKRDHALIKLTRKTFGDNFTIYADANGSYDVPMAIKIGRMMEEYKLGFFEEPVPFDYYEETKKIADTLTIPIALGEEEMSLRQFRYIIERDVAQVIQPDLMYFGGFIRSLKVARMAAVANKDCTLHMSGGGLGYLYVAHFASVVKNCGAHQEYKGEDDTLPVSCESSSLKSEKGLLKVPTGPGLGVQIDPAFLKQAQVVAA
ncbi:MAG TPA: mandelate racemase/muconate lactonizing enzyme family protein [Blastocatellia bacterium]|nr:mandelate racemase/muconate lactonizing enzyme family protein [Blastocatellia bacterium]